MTRLSHIGGRILHKVMVAVSFKILFAMFGNHYVLAVNFQALAFAKKPFVKF